MSRAAASSGDTRVGAELLVSELVTNAVQAGRAAAQSCPVRLCLRANRTRLLILVWDASPIPPTRLSASGNAENGRGLLLVEALSERWAWYFVPQDRGGKVVWALLKSDDSATALPHDNPIRRNYGNGE